MNEEVIHIEEEVMDVVHTLESKAKRWTEQISVAGGDLGHALSRLAKEATVRKITVQSQSGKTLFELPLVLGAAGALLIPPATAWLLVAAWLARVSILIEYEAAPTAIEEAADEFVEDVQAAVA